MKTRQKTILLLADWYLPAFKAGGPVRSCANLVAHLKDEFEFRIICRDTDYTDDAPLPGIEPDTWIKRSENEFVFYLSKKNTNRSSIQNLLKKTPFDIAYINGIYSFYFSILPAVLLRKKRRVIAARGMLAKSAIRVKGSKKVLFLRLMKLAGVYRNAIFQATNSSESEDIRNALGKNARVKLAPNLPEKRENFTKPEHAEKKRGHLSLISVARISPEKNLLYALNVLNNIKTDGLIRFDLYGPVYDEPYWKECQSLIEKLPKNIECIHHGSLPHAVLPEQLSNAHFLFMPTRGENFGHIILEAFAAGTPVLISDQTPWLGLGKKHIGFDLSLNNPDAFSETIETLVEMDNESFQTYSENAFNFAEEVFRDTETLLLNRSLFNDDGKQTN